MIAVYYRSMLSYHYRIATLFIIQVIEVYYTLNTLSVPKWVINYMLQDDGSVSQSDELIHALHSIHAVMSHIHLHSITMFSVVRRMYACPTYQDCAQTASHLYNLYRTQAESVFSHMASYSSYIQRQTISYSYYVLVQVC